MKAWDGDDGDDDNDRKDGASKSDIEEERAGAKIKIVEMTGIVTMV